MGFFLFLAFDAHSEKVAVVLFGDCGATQQSVPPVAVNSSSLQGVWDSKLLTEIGVQYLFQLTAALNIFQSIQ